MVSAAGTSCSSGHSDKHIRVTVIEPGLVGTELLEHVGDAATREAAERRYANEPRLAPEDIANAVVYAVGQPDHVGVHELLVRPTTQER